jgi:hypothetical protein
MALTQSRSLAASRLGNHIAPLKLVHRRSQELSRCYSAAAPAQVQPSQQRSLYANFAIYKGKAAASFRVSDCKRAKYITCKHEALREGINDQIFTQGCADRSSRPQIKSRDHINVLAQCPRKYVE